MSKLALLLGAGMTLQGAFRKIAGAYGQKRTQNKTAEMPAYEEVLVACRQMESGVGEQRAYEHFGERCGVASYRKLAGILTQNLQNHPTPPGQECSKGKWPLPGAWRVFYIFSDSFPTVGAMPYSR